MNEAKEQIRRGIAEHSAKAFKFFDEAKQIQRLVFKLPLAEREGVMNKVRRLENKAVEEAQKSIDLEKKLAASRPQKK